MNKERILVTVKTYPCISKAYMETVCTAGINDMGEWRRLYPIPYRYLEGDQQFKIWDVISTKVRKAERDKRVESYNPDLLTLTTIGNVSEWSDRGDWALGKVCPSIKYMIENDYSIGAVSVSEITDLSFEETENEWSPAQLEALKQQELFVQRKPLEKIPYKFKLRWKDHDGHSHQSTINAWEMCQTYRVYRKGYPDPLKVMKDKWMNDLFGSNRDVTLFVGNHSVFRESYMVVGWFCPPEGKCDEESLW